MATQTRNPTSDVASPAPTGTWSGSAPNRYTLIDDYPDSAGNDSITHGTAAGAILFGFPAFSIPAGSTVNSLSVQYYDQKSTGASNSIGARLYIGGTAYDISTPHSPNNGTWTNQVDTWTQNPRTTAAWTVDDVNGTGSNPFQYAGWASTDASPTILLSSIQVVVDYTPPSQTLTQGAQLQDADTFYALTQTNFTLKQAAQLQDADSFDTHSLSLAKTTRRIIIS